MDIRRPGFGKGLKKVTLNSKLYHKTTFEGLDEFICDFRSSEITSFSTENSNILIGAGNVCIVLKEKERTGYWTYGDADAGKRYGYDEFRVRWSLSELEKVVLPLEYEGWDDNNSVVKLEEWHIELLSRVEYLNVYTPIVYSDNDFYNWVNIRKIYN